MYGIEASSNYCAVGCALDHHSIGERSRHRCSVHTQLLGYARRRARPWQQGRQVRVMAARDERRWHGRGWQQNASPERQDVSIRYSKGQKGV
jgi:hypothetical protein